MKNEGGVTNFRGGFRPAIIPAGYVGVAFWGGVFVALSGSRLGATIAAGIFMTALLICLRYATTTVQQLVASSWRPFSFLLFCFASSDTLPMEL
jgi:Peptidase M50B-like